MSVEAVVCMTARVVYNGFDGHAALAEARNIRQPKGRTTYDRIDGHIALGWWEVPATVRVVCDGLDALAWTTCASH
jgi:hypothetical protein